jgi:hypothetical protein
MHAPQTRRGVLATSFGGIEVSGRGTHSKTYRLDRGYGALKAMSSLPRVAVAATIGPGSLQLHSISMTMPTWT